jgi:hypothetical protein
VRLRNLFWMALISALLYSQAAPAQTTASDTASAEIGEQEIAQAVEKLKTDPNLSGERKTKTLRWNDKDEKKKEEKKNSKFSMPKWLSWIGDLFSWLGETARVLVYLVVALFAALLAIWIIRYVRGSERLGAGLGSMNAPTHVRDLDIRPESLPDDIGKAALELWESGDHRASLSLLYRGLLSRLAHKFSVPIKHSSTEGECRVLALQHLPPQAHDYVSSLIRTWQGAVYGGTEPQHETVRHLCAHFATTFDSVPAPRPMTEAAGARA